jgi:hypothetical protein
MARAAAIPHLLDYCPSLPLDLKLLSPPVFTPGIACCALIRNCLVFRFSLQFRNCDRRLASRQWQKGASSGVLQACNQLKTRAAAWCPDLPCGFCLQSGAAAPTPTTEAVWVTVGSGWHPPLHWLRFGSLSAPAVPISSSRLQLDPSRISTSILFSDCSPANPTGAPVPVCARVSTLLHCPGPGDRASNCPTRQTEAE